MTDGSPLSCLPSAEGGASVPLMLSFYLLVRKVGTGDSLLWIQKVESRMFPGDSYAELEAAPWAEVSLVLRPQTPF